MRKMRTFLVGLATFSVVAAASAQFDGPAPVAWRFIQPTKVAPSGSPLVSGDSIYISVGGRVYAIDRATGNRRWQFPAVDPIEGTFKSAPIQAGDLLVASGDNKIIYGIDPAKGTNKWSYALPWNPLGQPVSVGKFIVQALTNNQLVCLDAATGVPVWDNPYRVLDGLASPNLAVYGNDVLYFTTRNELVALNVLNVGTSKPSDWRKQFGQLPPNATAVVWDENVYIYSGPYLVALNAISGSAKWQKPTPFTQLAFAPAVSPEGIFVTSTEGKSMIYSLDGEAKQRTPFDLGSGPVVRPTPVGSKYIIPTAKGALVLCDSSGNILWSYSVPPLAESIAATKSGNTGGGIGAGAAGNFGRGGRGGNTNSDADVPVTILASGVAVLTGQTLLVPMQDGSLIAFDKDLGVDLTPPDVKMLWPKPGDQINGQPPLEFSFKITDDASGVNDSTLAITVDGAPLTFEYKRDGTAHVVFSLTGKNKPLLDGRKDIVVTVKDWIGNEVKKHFSLSIDNTLAPLKKDNDNQNNGFGPGGRGRGGFGGGGAGAGD